MNMNSCGNDFRATKIEKFDMHNKDVASFEMHCECPYIVHLSHMQLTCNPTFDLKVKLSYLLIISAQRKIELFCIKFITGNVYFVVEGRRGRDKKISTITCHESALYDIDRCIMQP